MMTPEERFTRMENLMQLVIETQAKFSERLDRLAERQEKQQVLIEQDQAAIRDLIAVSRFLLESHRESEGKLKALTEDVKLLNETVREGQAKMDALIDTVDRIIRRDQRPS